MLSLHEWAARWGIPDAAVRELAGFPAYEPIPTDSPLTTEGGVQAAVRLEAARAGIHCFRNNNGAGAIVDVKKLCPRCAPLARAHLRWGLANESPAVNAVLKSADLIGFRSRLTKPDDVGKMVAVFWSREIKKPGWHYTGAKGEPAQLRWHTLVTAAGGDSAIVNGTGSIK